MQPDLHHGLDMSSRHRPLNRIRLAYRWVPRGTKRLLDAGCAAGDGTCHYLQKAKEVWGIDPDEGSILSARRRYRDIDFAQGQLEVLPFADGFFDVVTLTDVLEHVHDEEAALNEIYRVTKVGSTIIVTTPHAGMFAWLDPYNYGTVLRSYLPRTYQLLRRVGLARASAQCIQKHRHYSLDDLERLLDRSEFRCAYKITATFRSGCLVYPLYLNLFEALTRLFPQRVVEMSTTPVRWLAELDYWIPYGQAAYNIGICVKRS